MWPSPGKGTWTSENCEEPETSSGPVPLVFKVRGTMRLPAVA